MDKPFVLIIEDERDVAALFRHVIDLAGYQTEVVTHGRVAIKRLSNSQPAIVILDLNLPGASGGEILKIIRNDERLVHTKVIVITAYAHIADSLAEQSDLVLLKPVSIEQLTKLMSRFNVSKKSQKAKPMRQKPLDSHTGLYNQPFFIHRLESSLKQAKEIDGYLFAVLLFSVEPKNKLEKKADSENWVSVLREVAESFKNILRPTDTLARFDQDNFYILLEDISKGDISIVIANRIQEKLQQDIVDIENKIQFPIRIGILLCDSRYEKVDAVLNDASRARAQASAQGDEDSNYYLLSGKK